MSQWLRIVWPPIALAALVMAAYANSFSSGFVLDNRAIILEDPRLRSVSLPAVRHIFSEEYWWPTATGELYRPLTTLSFWFNYAVLGNGSRPFGYHLVNFALHLANVLLLWCLIRRVAQSDRIGWIAAALFAVHPLGVEAVTNLVGRADLFATLGILIAAISWLNAEDATSPRRARAWRIASALAGALAVLAKENGVMAVGAIALLTVRRDGWRSGARIFLRRGLPVVLPTLMTMVAARMWIYLRSPPVGEVTFYNPIADWHGFMTAIGVIGRYLLLAVWPASLSCDYSYPQIPEFGTSTVATVQAWTSMAALGLIATFTWRQRSRWPNLAFGLAWGATMLLPVSNLLVRIGSVMSERFLYLPMTGLALAGAAILAGACRGQAEKGPKADYGIALLALCLGAVTVRTHLRNYDWRNDCTIWESAAHTCPQSYKVYMGLASCHLREPLTESNLDIAIEYAEHARAILDSPPLPIERENNTVWPKLGNFYRVKADFCAARGDNGEARLWRERSVAVLKKSIAVNRWWGAEVKRRFALRGDTAATARFYGNPKIYEQLAIVQASLNRYSDAEATLTERRLLIPNDAENIVMLGVIARERKQLDLAAARFIQAVLLENANERAWRALADVYHRLKVSPLPVTPRKNGGHIEATSPLVRTHLNSALVRLVRSFRLAGRNAEASKWKERAIREFAGQPELFEDTGTVSTR